MGLLLKYLKKLSVDELKAVASLWRINDFASYIHNDTDFNRKKQEQINEIIRRMREEDRIKSVVSALSDREQHILGTFALNNWVISRSELALWDITEDELGTSPSAQQTGKQQKGLLGLLLIVKSRRYKDVGAVAYAVPEELRDGITAALSSETNAEVHCDIHIISEPHRIMDDIIVFLSHANAGIPLTPSLRKIRKRCAEKIMRELSEQSQRYLLFIRRICEMLEIVRQNTQNRKILLKTTDKAEKFMRKSREERMLEILHAFSRTYDSVKRTVLDELRKLKPDVWYDRTLFERNVRSAVFRKKRKEWFYFNKSSVKKVIQHLVLLGLADIGTYVTNIIDNSNENASADLSFDVFRLKSAFFGFYERAKGYEKTLIVQPNFEIIAFPETSDEVMFLLTRFASLKKADRVATFVITKESVMRAVESGMSTDEILSVLREHARNDIPQNIIFTIRSWCDLLGKTVLKRCIFIRTEPEIMEILKKWINIAEVADGCGLCDEDAFHELIRTRDVFVIEVDDDATAAAVESVMKESGVNVRKHANLFLIERSDVSECVSALRRRGMFLIMERKCRCKEDKTSAADFS